MKNLVRKLVATFLIITMLTCMFTGCGEDEADNSNTTELSWYINFSWFSTNWGENLVSKEITKKTGCSIDFIVPTGNPSEKLDSMIDSETLPDILTLGWWEPQVAQMINNKDVYALDELADQYDTYFYNVTDKQIVKWHSSSDGHLYKYPNSAYSPEDYKIHKSLSSNEAFLVRKDIYEAIGSPDMSTPEGFTKAVKKAAEMFPTVDGNELIPIGATEFTETGCDSFDNYLLDFLATPYVTTSNEALDRYKDSDLLLWLKTFRKLCNEGYLKDEVFIDTRTQMSEKIAKGQYFCMLYQHSDIEQEQKILAKNNPDSIYIAVDGPKSGGGDEYTLPGLSENGWTVTMISKNCKDPEKAIKLLTYLISEEGQLMTWMGVEGTTWDYDENHIPKMHDDVSQLLATDREAFDKKYGADSCYWMLQNDAMASDWIIKSDDDPLKQMEQWTIPYTVDVGQYLTYLDPDSLIGKIKIRADKLWGNTLPKLLTAKTDEECENIYSQYIKEKYDMGYNKVLNASTLQMKENRKKLGLDDEK